jgi:Transposase IS116/IS110/IS902 family
VLLQLDRELDPIDHMLANYARRQPGHQALIANLDGVGAVTATAILAELGDVPRFPSSDDAVRHSGLGHAPGPTKRRPSLATKGAAVPLSLRGGGSEKSLTRVAGLSTSSTTLAPVVAPGSYCGSRAGGGCLGLCPSSQAPPRSSYSARTSLTVSPHPHSQTKPY